MGELDSGDGVPRHRRGPALGTFSDVCWDPVHRVRLCAKFSQR